MADSMEYMQGKNGRYKVNTSQLIGEGGFGKVYKGFDLKNDIPLAMKVVDISPLGSKLKEIQRKERMTREEIELMELLKDRPFILEIVDSFESDFFKNKHGKFLILVLEYCAYGNLEEFMEKWRKNKPFSESEAAHIFDQVLQGVEQVHVERYLHRDLSAANIFVKEADRDKNRLKIRIADFGLSRVVERKALYSVAGTPGCMAPEVAQGRPYDLSADIFSLGIVFLLLLTGRSLRGKRLLKIEDFLQEHSDVLSVEAEDLARQMLKTSPLRRITLEELRKHQFLRKNLLPLGRHGSRFSAASHDSGFGSSMKSRKNRKALSREGCTVGPSRARQSPSKGRSCERPPAPHCASFLNQGVCGGGCLVHHVVSPRCISLLRDGHCGGTCLDRVHRCQSLQREGKCLGTCRKSRERREISAEREANSPLCPASVAIVKEPKTALKARIISYGKDRTATQFEDGSIRVKFRNGIAIMSKVGRTNAEVSATLNRKEIELKADAKEMREYHETCQYLLEVNRFHTEFNSEFPIVMGKAPSVQQRNQNDKENKKYPSVLPKLRTNEQDDGGVSQMLAKPTVRSAPPMRALQSSENVEQKPRQKLCFFSASIKNSPCIGCENADYELIIFTESGQIRLLDKRNGQKSRYNARSELPPEAQVMYDRRMSAKIKKTT